MYGYHILKDDEEDVGRGDRLLEKREERSGLCMGDSVVL